MGLTNAGANAMHAGLAAVAGFASLHSADPGSLGSNELSGGSPAYARKAITWAAPSGGNLDSSNQPVFDVPAGSHVAYFGLWSAVSGGTFYGSGILAAQEDYAQQGQYTLSDADNLLT